jgi:hypothetical protein
LIVAIIATAALSLAVVEEVSELSTLGQLYIEDRIGSITRRYAKHEGIRIRKYLSAFTATFVRKRSIYEE